MALDLSVSGITLTLAVPGVVSSTPLVGYAPDDLYTIEDRDTGETMMGLDGVLSGGYVPAAVIITFKQMANSLTESFFDNWAAAEDQAFVKYPGSAIIVYPGLSKQAILTNGFLRARKPLPDAAKLLQPQTHRVEFQSISIQGL